MASSKAHLETSEMDFAAIRLFISGMVQPIWRKA